MDSAASVSAIFTPVAPGTRWEYSWISVSLCHDDGTIAWSPEPVDWLLMTENSMAQMVLGHRHLLLRADAAYLGRWKWVFSHEVGGVKVYQHNNQTLPRVVLVRQVSGPMLIKVECKALSDCLQIDCVGGEGRVFSEWYGLHKAVTIATLRSDLMEHLMLWRSVSRYTHVHFSRSGGTSPLAGGTVIWSPSWDAVEWKPRRRVFGKQPYMRQMTLDEYFNKVSL